MQRSTQTFIALCLLAAVSGCGGVRSVAETPQPAAGAPAWPAPPAAARIRFVKLVSGPRDLGLDPPFAHRLLQTFSGKGEEHFVRPTGVASEGERLFVADPGAQVLWMLDAGAGTYAGIREAGRSPLLSPVAVAAGGDGTVFVADTVLGQVFLLDRAGKLLREIAATGLARPAGLAFDRARAELYVADADSDRIFVFDRDAKLQRQWGKRGGGDGEFNHPTHLAWTAAGDLLVTDALNFRVQAFDRTGRFLWKMGRHGDGSGDLASPKGVGADSHGDVFLVDALFDAVQVFDREGRLLLSFGDHGTRAGQFWLPGGLFVDDKDRIYVTDTYNQRVQVFELVAVPGRNP